MPVVRTKKAMDRLKLGQVLEVMTTDPGSLADIQGWAKSTGHQYLKTEREGEMLKHFLRKAGDPGLREEQKHPNEIHNEELAEKLTGDEEFVLIDVREPAEYASGHIPGANSIHLGQLEEKMNEIPKDQPVYVICHTGKRGNTAACQLTKHGFQKVFNVIPGMSGWTGPIHREK